MAKYFKTAFAKNGDRATVPESTQVDGSVSFEQGYGIDYERDQETDPQAKDIGRESFNGLFHDMTEAIGEVQSSGVAQWISGVSYPKGALVWRNKVLHLSISDANTSTPPSDKWTVLYDKSNTTVDKNNFIRAEGTKTTVVTDDITHDVNETSREKVASAELASRKITGGDVVQTTGQSTVDVMSQKASNDEFNNTFGRSQRWIDVTSERIRGVTYVNNTKNTIFIWIQKAPSETVVEIKIGNESFVLSTLAGSVTFTLPVAPNQEYSQVSGTVVNWKEFR